VELRRAAAVLLQASGREEDGSMTRGCLLWLIGIPLPIIILLWLMGYL
jgi:hypothetical protein